MTLYLNLYSAERPTPRQFDVLKAILDDWRKSREKSLEVRYFGRPGPPTLVFGSEGPISDDNQIHYTYSFKQIESRANAATVIHAKLDTIFGLEKGLPPSTHFVPESIQQFRDGIENIKRDFDFTKPIAVDVETRNVLGEEVTQFTAPMICIAFAQEDKSYVFPLYSDEWDKYTERERITYLEEIVSLIEKPIFHNGKFDIAVIETNLGVRMSNWFDTMLAHHALNHAAREHGLKPLCIRYFGAADWEADIKQWVKGKRKDYAAIPWTTIAKYNNFDVLWTYRLWQKLSVEIEADENAQSALYLEMQAAEFLFDVEKAGIPFHRQNAGALEMGYLLAATDEQALMWELTENEDFNPGSHVQVKREFAKLGVELPSTGEEVIEELLKDENLNKTARSLAVSLIKFRKARKMVSTYIIPWRKAARIQGDDRVHPTFNVHGTTTGRLSSSDPNAQNVPRDKEIRRMVTLR